MIITTNESIFLFKNITFRMFKIIPTDYYVKNDFENIFILYINNKIQYLHSNLTLSHIIIDKPSLDDMHLYYLNNSPNVCLIEYKNAYCKSKVHDTDLINCVKYVHSTNKYIPVRKRLHYDNGLRNLYKDYIVDDNNYDSSYYNIIKYYHQEYLDFKPAFDRILNTYTRAIKNNRYDILEYLNTPINENFAIVCDTNTTMYKNYIETGKYDLDNSIIFDKTNENYKSNDLGSKADLGSLNLEWYYKLPRDKIKERYYKVITDHLQIGNLVFDDINSEII